MWYNTNCCIKWKRECELIILNIKLKNHIQMIKKFISIIAFAFIIITALILLKYKLAYKVSIKGEFVGYITNKYVFEEKIENEILNPDEINVAFVDIEEMPVYDMLLIKNSIETSEEEIFTKIKEAAVTTYKIYAITVAGENTTYVNSRDEAEEIITKMKEESQNADEIEIGMQEIFTKKIEETMKTVEVATATEVASEQLTLKIEENEKIKAATFDGVYFSVRPVTGTITSRFGANEAIRDHTHKGIDIAAPNGTDIKAAAGGTISYAGTMGGYGNLVIIDHENGIQTYYGHCSKIYVSVGDSVEAGDTIAAVGSTGFSTGNHLHFEIRKNGAQINPQQYLYK